MQAWYHCENVYPFVPQKVLDEAESVRASSVRLAHNRSPLTVRLRMPPPPSEARLPHRP